MTLRISGIPGGLRAFFCVDSFYSVNLAIFDVNDVLRKFSLLNSPNKCHFVIDFASKFAFEFRK